MCKDWEMLTIAWCLTAADPESFGFLRARRFGSALPVVAPALVEASTRRRLLQHRESQFCDLYEIPKDAEYATRTRGLFTQVLDWARRRG